MLVGAPPSALVILVGFGYIWGRRWRFDPGIRHDLVRHTMVFICQVALTFIYPLYIYGFTSLTGVSQLLYVLRLPLIKSLSKNWISYNLSHNNDIKPEVIIFNVEVFNALYVSAAVQESTSLRTTITLMIIDVLHFWFSMRGTIGILNKVKDLTRKIPPHHPAAAESCVEIALRLLATEEHPLARTNTPLVPSAALTTSETHSSSAPEYVQILSATRTKRMMLQVCGMFPTSLLRVPKATRISPIEDAGPVQSLEEIFSADERTEFISTTIRVLYITEFLVLVEYTEAVLPMVYALYSMISFHLPNGVYNQSFVNVSRQDLFANVGSVLAYSMLELTSLILAMLVLKRTLRLISSGLFWRHRSLS